MENIKQQWICFCATWTRVFVLLGYRQLHKAAFTSEIQNFGSGWLWIPLKTWRSVRTFPNCLAVVTSSI
jgi:hypothetical protein